MVVQTEKHRIVRVNERSGHEQFYSLEGLGRLDAATIALHAPDSQWLLLDRDRPAARCSLWHSRTPPFRTERVGYIGHYAASSQTVAGALLEHACVELRRQGCTLAIAPIDGNTWRRYRLMTQRGSRPVFFLEPDNPDDWPSHFTSHGFMPTAAYYSALAQVADGRLSGENNQAMEAAAAGLSSSGFSIRPFDAQNFEAEMHSIFRISLAAFAGNLLYSSIGEEEFRSQYAAIRPRVDPNLVWMAEFRGEPAGFAFAVPDLLQVRRGEPLDTVVFKTLAVDPRFSRRGLGGLLVHRAQQAALDRGFRNVIHALIYEKNPSTHISARYATVFRRYALYARPLR